MEPLYVALIGFAGVVVGALISGGTSYFLSKQRYLRELKLRKRDEKMRKIEEVIMEMNHLNDEIAALSELSAAIAVEHEWDDLIEFHRQSRLLRRYLASAEVKIALYAPEYRKDFAVMRGEVPAFIQSRLDLFEVSQSVDVEKVNENQTITAMEHVIAENFKSISRKLDKLINEILKRSQSLHFK